MNLTLRPYKPSDAAIITSWIKDEYRMHQWCADRYKSYPVTPEDMNCYHKQFIDGVKSIALTMCDGNEVVGYITLRKPDDIKTEQRIGFVIVDDSKRSRGLGKTLVRMAVDFAFERLEASKISLGVFENNPNAIHCYEAAGFQRVARTEPEKYDCLGETWKCIEMEIIKSTYTKDEKIKDNQSLKSLSLEELWELFPIVLVPYNPDWKDWAEEEIENLRKLLAKYSPVINHIGSTAIGGIMSKPTVDILVEIPVESDWGKVWEIMEGVGYLCMSELNKGRMSFNKGYTPSGYADKVFHIHVHAMGDNTEIFFRDFLGDHPDTAKEYEALKLSLLPKFKHDRDGYTEAKTEFIERIISKRKN